MLGKAQKLFSERQMRSKPSIAQEAKRRSSWPLLEKLLNNGYLGYIDFALARQFGKENEEIASFLCHMSMSARQGHLCIKIDNSNITPSPSDVWIADDSKTSMSNDDLGLLTSLILKGANNAPPALIQKNNHLYYFQKNWGVESNFIANLTNVLSASEPALSLDSEKIMRHIQELQSDGKLLPEQAEAVLQACKSTLTLITGGPGTGKTHTAGVLLKTIWDGLTNEQRNNHIQITLAAPTGKAAANLEASIKRALKDTPNFPEINGQTLHQLLKVRSNSSSTNALSADILIVDECSMIDADLMGCLLGALKPGSRVILLGDKNQLPSVEAGSLFADMTTYLSSHKPCTIELKKCLRAESKGIVDFAEHVKNGDTQAISQLFTNSIPGVHCTSFPEGISPKEQQHLFLKYAVPHIPTINHLPENPIQLLNMFNGFRILTPLRKGLLGSESLNTAISATLQSKMKNSGFTATPIMIVRNDYRLNLFNGEVGVLVKFQDNSHTNDYAIFHSRQPGQQARKIPALLVPKYEPAYCLSIHKSQGSEFDHVVLLLPEGSQSFGREGLYTGASRAKKHLDIWSRPDILVSMTNKQATRLSGIT